MFREEEGTLAEKHSGKRPTRKGTKGNVVPSAVESCVLNYVCAEIARREETKGYRHERGKGTRGRECREIRNGSLGIDEKVGKKKGSRDIVCRVVCGPSLANNKRAERSIPCTRTRRAEGYYSGRLIGFICSVLVST